VAVVPTFSIITATLQRDSLSQCCLSVNCQTHTAWRHIVVADGGPLRGDHLNSIRHPQRDILCLGKRCGNFGNTPRHLGWQLATGDYCIYLDDDNHFARPDALADISRCLDEQRFPKCECGGIGVSNASGDITRTCIRCGAVIGPTARSRPDWAVFPIERFGQRFFSEDPKCCHVDTANLVISREIAQWPDRDEYTLDGIFCEELKARHPFRAFPEINPVIIVPIQGKGEL
jgi:hypothetical protein